MMSSWKVPPTPPWFNVGQAGTAEGTHEGSDRVYVMSTLKLGERGAAGVNISSIYGIPTPLLSPSKRVPPQGHVESIEQM